MCADQSIQKIIAIGLLRSGLAAGRRYSTGV